jgi:hypothetical protein
LEKRDELRVADGEIFVLGWNRTYNHRSAPAFYSYYKRYQGIAQWTHLEVGHRWEQRRLAGEPPGIPVGLALPPSHRDQLMRELCAIEWTTTGDRKIQLEGKGTSSPSSAVASRRTISMLFTWPSALMALSLSTFRENRCVFD